MLTKDMVERVAQLARLRLETEELDAIRMQLSVVLENFEQIATVDTTGIEPLVTPSDVTPTSREDVPDESAMSEEIIGIAPEKSGRTYKVPPVV